MPGYSVVPDYGTKNYTQSRQTGTVAAFIAAPTSITVNPSTVITQGIYIIGVWLDIAGTTTRVQIGDGTTFAVDTKQTSGFQQYWFPEPLRMAKSTAIALTIAGGSPDVGVGISYMVGA